MQVKIKKLSKLASIPTKKPNDAGWDLKCIGRTYTEKYVEYETGLAVEIPNGYLGLLFPRSSISNKDLTLANSVGLIDPDYRGSIRARMRYNAKSEDDYNFGDKVVQLVIIPYPEIEFVESEELSSTERNEGGFGHTDVSTTMIFHHTTPIQY